MKFKNFNCVESMSKYLIYTSNLIVVPKTVSEIKIKNTRHYCDYLMTSSKFKILMQVLIKIKKKKNTIYLKNHKS